MLPIAKFLPLLHLRGKRLEDITTEELSKIAEILGIKVNVDDELVRAGMALLRGDNIDTVADMIQSPESIQKIMLFLQGKSEQDFAIEGELVELYSGNAMDAALSVEPTVAARKEPASSVVQPSGLIGSTSVGWRLPSRGIEI